MSTTVDGMATPWTARRRTVIDQAGQPLRVGATVEYRGGLDAIRGWLGVVVAISTGDDLTVMVVQLDTDEYVMIHNVNRMHVVQRSLPC